MFTLGGRNNFMAEKGLPAPKATSTGTTIVGCLFKDGIVLGADTRATEGPIVADKNCEKVLIYHSFHIFLCNPFSQRFTISPNLSDVAVQERPLILNLLLP